MNESSTAQRANKVNSVEQMNKWALWANERTDKGVAQYLHLDSWLFQTTVHRRHGFLQRYHFKLLDENTTALIALSLLWQPLSRERLRSHRLSSLLDLYHPYFLYPPQTTTVWQCWRLACILLLTFFFRSTTIFASTFYFTFLSRLLSLPPLYPLRLYPHRTVVTTQPKL